MVLVDSDDDVSWESIDDDDENVATGEKSQPSSARYTSTWRNADKVGNPAGATSTTKIPVKVMVMKRVPISDTSDSKNDMKDRQPC